MKTGHVLLICLTALLFGIFFWPGIYRYDHVGDLPIRTNHMTGAVQLFRGDGWSPMNPSTKGAKLVPPDVLGKLNGVGEFQYGTLFSAKLHNGSDWTLSEIEYEISAVQPKPDGSQCSLVDIANGEKCAVPLWTRQFRRAVTVPPMGAGSDVFEVGGSVEGYRPQWRILAAKGRRD